MAKLEPEGEGIRKAVRWISDQRQADPSLVVSKIVDEAAKRFDLSPLETDFLLQSLAKQSKEP